MIAKLSGLIDNVGSNYVIIEVNGVGYLVYASSRTLAKIGAHKGTPVSLLIETIVREDQITLYGFADAAEKEWFLILCTVQGVGAKVAQSILAAVPADRLPVVIASQDKAAIKMADGVGEKLAVRIITELKEKAGKMALGLTATQQAQSATGKKGKGGAPAAELPVAASNDAVSALINLGYGRSEAFSAVADVLREKGDDLPLGDLIRESLKELSA
ncbi:MAG: Holliday junction branch migration protein RuvA [Alphaproteobacteria bacterium]|nr:Holliday junction branch migration protein RuvA [Alphaproteobacteria bacterium]MDE2337273.1 Holliday junction branch migration protein RuvA [Alphaproteobacteria bacterium]